MKVAIDIRRISDFGIGTYIRNVVRTLGRLDQNNEFVLLETPGAPRTWARCRPTSLTSSARITITRRPPTSSSIAP